MKLSIKSTTLIALLTLYFLSVMNLSFWRSFVELVPFATQNDWVFALSVPFFIGSVLLLLFTLITLPYIGKPLIITLLIASSMANYGMFNLGIYIDSDMIRNLFETNQREALDLLTVKSALWIMGLGILPALLLCFTKITYHPLGKELLMRLIFIIIAFGTTAIIAALAYKEYATFSRNNREIVRLINPTNYLSGTYRYLQKMQLANREFTIIDPDARHTPYPDEDITVLIVVLGETTRAANFGLNGYERNTTPKLSQKEVIAFQKVSSCGTATAISVPCMFSNMNRKNFDVNDAKFSENIFDLAQKTNYSLWWRDNDDGCKGVCTRIPHEIITQKDYPEHCDGMSCYDEALLVGLEETLASLTQDTIIVLHTIGSHGPTYFKRYPDHFKQFTPTCDTAEIQSCSQEEIRNTYDNTILYTDHIIASTIDILESFPQYESGLLYISDHGESLGENNLYLHGLPYSIAPKEQTEVPMIFWFSQKMIDNDYLDQNCLQMRAKHDPFSHDHLFHSLLSLLELKSDTYDKNLDIFEGCRTYHQDPRLTITP